MAVSRPKYVEHISSRATCVSPCGDYDFARIKPFGTIKRVEMKRAVSTSDSCSKRLSTITEYSEPAVDSDDNDRSGRHEEESAIPSGVSEILEEQAAEVKYFLLDDSPMAKFSRSIKWIYKKVSLES